ncbi:MAG: MFS transporter [Actinophytocola sp.]|nr:MFS transporter [Actinophytocola sp.]
MAGVKADGSPVASQLFPMRTVVFGALAPALLFGIALGIALPIVPASASLLGANLAVAGFVVALLPIGKVLADVPAGAIASRIGDDNAMFLAAVLGVAAFAGAALAPSLLVLEVSILLVGVSSAVFHLARHSYLTEVTPPTHRARVLSTLGGTHRLGYLVGPFLGAVVIANSSVQPAYWLAMGCTALALVVLLAARSSRAARRYVARPAERATVWGVAREHRRLFHTLGVATLLVGSVRGARQTVLPLWGEYLGLDPATVSLVFGLSGALDIMLFYPAGHIMDRFGRLWVALPSMLAMGVAMAALPFTTGLVSMSLAAGLLGLGNGFGSGIIMTLGADVAPADSRSAFLGVWRLFQDIGEGVGPLVLTVGAALGSLAVGIWVAAAFGGLSSWALARWVPRYSRTGSGA